MVLFASSYGASLLLLPTGGYGGWWKVKGGYRAKGIGEFFLLLLKDFLSLST